MGSMRMFYYKLTQETIMYCLKAGILCRIKANNNGELSKLEDYTLKNINNGLVYSVIYMKSFEEYLNKQCSVMVGFMGSAINTGMVPLLVYGILLEETEDYLIVDVSYAKCSSVIMKYKDITGKTYINKNFIIALNVG